MAARYEPLRRFLEAHHDHLSWLGHPEPVMDLAGELRDRMEKASASPPAKAARALGWLFSGWVPELSRR